MKGRAFKGAILVIFCLTALLLWFHFLQPQITIRSLEEQVAKLKELSHQYEKRGDKLTALKFAQIAHLVEATNEEEGPRICALSAFFDEKEQASAYADHVRAEDMAAEEIRILGEPLLTQLTIVLENDYKNRGIACVGLRVLGRISRERVAKCTAKLIREGKNDLLTREAVILALVNEQSGLEKDLVDLVWKWQGWGRQYPIHVLRRVKSTIGEEAIIAALDDSSPAVRRHATRALGEIGTGKSLGPLRHLLTKEKDKIVKTLAEKAIAHIKAQIPSLEKPNQR